MTMLLNNPTTQPVESAYQFIPLHAKTITPLHQGALKEAVRPNRLSRYENLQVIRSTEIWTPNGQWMEVPSISGNSIRGRLRRAIARDFLLQLQQYNDDPQHILDKYLNPRAGLSNLERFTLQLFYAGGSLKSKDSPKAKTTTPPADTSNTLSTTTSSETDANEATDTPATAKKTFVTALKEDLNRTEFETIFPMFPVLGYASGDNHLVPGAVSFPDLLPFLEETQQYFKNWEELWPYIMPAVNQSIPSWLGLLQQHDLENLSWPQQGATHVDPTHATFAHFDDLKKSRSDDEAKLQMPFYMEYLPSNIQLFGGIYLHESMNSIERGMVYRGLRILQHDGFLGGQRARGYGRVQWHDHSTSAEQEDQNTYLNYVKEIAPKAFGMLPNLVELRETKKNTKTTTRKPRTAKK